MPSSETWPTSTSGLHQAQQLAQDCGGWRRLVHLVGSMPDGQEGWVSCWGQEIISRSKLPNRRTLLSRTFDHHLMWWLDSFTEIVLFFLLRHTFAKSINCSTPYESYCTFVESLKQQIDWCYKIKVSHVQWKGTLSTRNYRTFEIEELCMFR